MYAITGKAVGQSTLRSGRLVRCCRAGKLDPANGSLTLCDHSETPFRAPMNLRGFNVIDEPHSAELPARVRIEEIAIADTGMPVRRRM